MGGEEPDAETSRKLLAEAAIAIRKVCATLHTILVGSRGPLR
jgi:hypothetical protein